MCGGDYYLLHSRDVVRAEEGKVDGRNSAVKKKSTDTWRYIIFNEGSFALWAGLFSMTDCALIAIRG